MDANYCEVYQIATVQLMGLRLSDFSYATYGFTTVRFWLCNLWVYDCPILVFRLSDFGFMRRWLMWCFCCLVNVDQLAISVNVRWQPMHVSCSSSLQPPLQGEEIFKLSHMFFVGVYVISVVSFCYLVYLASHMHWGVLTLPKAYMNPIGFV